MVVWLLLYLHVFFFRFVNLPDAMFKFCLNLNTMLMLFCSLSLSDISRTMILLVQTDAGKVARRNNTDRQHNLSQSMNDSLKQGLCLREVQEEEERV